MSATAVAGSAGFVGSFAAVANMVCGGLAGTWVVGTNGIVGLYYGDNLLPYSLPFGPGTIPNFSAVTVPGNGTVWIGGSNGSLWMGTEVGNNCSDYTFVQEPVPNPNMKITNIQVDLSTGVVVITGVDQTTGASLAYAANLSVGTVQVWDSFLNLLPINPQGLNHVLETTPGDYWMVGDGGMILNDPAVNATCISNNSCAGFTTPTGLPVNVTVILSPGASPTSLPLSSIDFNDVEAVSPNELFVVGTHGVVLEDLNGVWSQVAVGETPYTLNKIAVESGNQIVFVGNNDTVLEFTGSNTFCLCQGYGSDNILDICGYIACMGGFLTYINPNETLCGFVATTPTACINQPTTIQVEAFTMGSINTAYVGVVSISDVTDPTTTFNPDPIDFTAANDGIATFQATFHSTGIHQVYFVSNTCTVPNLVEIMVGNCFTATPSVTPTVTPTCTPTTSPTWTQTVTPSSTPSTSPTVTGTATPTSTPSDTGTNTETSTETKTPTDTLTNTPSPTHTPTGTFTPPCETTEIYSEHGVDEVYYSDIRLIPDPTLTPVDSIPLQWEAVVTPPPSGGIQWDSVGYVPPAGWYGAICENEAQTAPSAGLGGVLQIVPVTDGNPSGCWSSNPDGSNMYPGFADWIGVTPEPTPCPGCYAATATPSGALVPSGPFNNGDQFWTRRTFSLPAGACVTSAALSWSVDNYAVPYINGVPVSVTGIKQFWSVLSTAKVSVNVYDLITQTTNPTNFVLGWDVTNFDQGSPTGLT
jgi:hypothetical protein